MRWLVLLLQCSCLFSLPIETFYGVIEVEEPVLLELIESAPMQRLKLLHQYGVAYYTTHSEEYNRFDHSLGVLAILRMNGTSLEEQISGLLHDVSHTAFSHVGDYYFQTKGCHQDEIFDWYLKESGLEQILQKHGISDINPKSGKFTALDQELPGLCADRIDYNLQGAFYQGFLTKEEAIQLLHDFRFAEGQWIAANRDLVEKMALFSLFMTQDCWGSARNYFTSHSLSSAIRRGIEIGLIEADEIHFGTDDSIWNRLIASEDQEIQKQMDWTLHPEKLFSLDLENPDRFISLKFRGIDPLVQIGGEMIPLTKANPLYREEFVKVKERMERGWEVRLHLSQ